MCRTNKVELNHGSVRDVIGERDLANETFPRCNVALKTIAKAREMSVTRKEGTRILPGRSREIGVS